MLPRPLDEPILSLMRVHFLQGLDEVLAHGEGGLNLAETWDALFHTLEALPLASDDVGLARRRLESIRRYLAAGEHGAASFEARLLRSLLARE
jgi:hypothetical protein